MCHRGLLGTATIVALLSLAAASIAGQTPAPSPLPLEPHSARRGAIPTCRASGTTPPGRRSSGRLNSPGRPC